MFDFGAVTTLKCSCGNTITASPHEAVSKGWMVLVSEGEVEAFCPDDSKPHLDEEAAPDECPCRNEPREDGFAWGKDCNLAYLNSQRALNDTSDRVEEYEVFAKHISMRRKHSMSIRAKGIDVSRWKVIKNIDEVRASGITFIGVKATEGNTVVDPTLKLHQDMIRGSKAFDLTLYYHFARSGPPDKQAERLMRTVGRLTGHERLVLDLEVLPTSPEKTLQWVDSFYDRIMREYPNEQQIIYTSRRIWRMFGDPLWDRSEKVDLWAPRYNTHAEPSMPAPWATRSWRVWQWSDGEFPENVVPGVGKCDANVWHGDEKDLIAWRQQGSSPASPTSAPFMGNLDGFMTSLDDGQVGLLHKACETLTPEQLREALRWEVAIRMK